MKLRMVTAIILTLAAIWLGYYRWYAIVGILLVIAAIEYSVWGCKMVEKYDCSVCANCGRKVDVRLRYKGAVYCQECFDAISDEDDLK